MLAVDIGNTFTRIAAFAEDAIRARRSYHTLDLRVEEVMEGLEELAPFADSPRMWVASVAPSANAIVDSAAERAGFARRFIKPSVDAILPHRLSTPETTGVDRLLSAMAAGVRLFPGDAGRRGYVVVQCGSAATIDLVDAQGVFRGGYIIPGPTLWLQGISRAAQLPDFSNDPPDWHAVAVGDNTRDAIMHGMVLALPLAVAGVAMLLHANPGDADEVRGENLPVAITGGWGEKAVPFMRGRREYDRDLLLHGIRIFAKRNP